MARLTRAEVFDPNEITVAHVMNRTVRRCFLFGDDPVSGKNFDHRKVWIEEYLQHFAGCFGIDLLCFSILSNHFHLILRSRPDVVASWDDTEVARRWLMICPHRRGAGGKPLPPTEPELDSIRNCPVRLQEIRSRLSNISWWMRLLCQRVAQRANKEDDENGRFFQDRYRAVRLIDEASLLACAVYVDLNPIRAAIVESLEQSDHTSAQKRIQSLQNDHCENNPAPVQTKAAKRIPRRSPDGFLSPVDLSETTGDIGGVPNQSGTRCSDKGFLPLPASRYIELLDWTARQIAKGKRGTVPSDLAPIMHRLGLSPSAWCELVADFGKLFQTIAGNPVRVDTERSRQTQRRFRVHHRARELFLSA